jgi:hypothetical protein
MKCAVITINYLYDGKIINHAELVPRSSKSRTPAADKNRGFLVLYLLYISFLLPISAVLFLGVALTRAHDVTRGAFCLPKAVGHLSITGLRQ